MRMSLNSNRGNETFDYKDNYCYIYDDLKFDGLTPEEFILATQVPIDDRDPESGIFFPDMVSVGVILPKMAPSGIHQFKLCLANYCVSAGSVATFGSATQNTSSSHTVDKRTHYLVEYEVTDLVADQGWTESVSKLAARLVDSLLEVPGPVVILRTDGVGSGGSVVYGPGQQPDDYGNILEKFKDEQDNIMPS